METESFELWTILPATPEEIYAAWLDAAAHSAFTGSAATVEPVIGGRFTAWDGYIEGSNQELEPGRRILQAWRTSEFAEEHPDSLLELVFEPHEEGTRLTLRHSNIPEGQGSSYESGWQTHYFTPMAEYFGGQAEPAPEKKTPARRRAPAKKPATRKAQKAAPAKRQAPTSKEAVTRKAKASAKKVAGKSNSAARRPSARRKK